MQFRDIIFILSVSKVSAQVHTHYTALQTYIDFQRAVTNYRSDLAAPATKQQIWKYSAAYKRVPLWGATRLIAY